MPSPNQHLAQNLSLWQEESQGSLHMQQAALPVNNASNLGAYPAVLTKNRAQLLTQNWIAVACAEHAWRGRDARQGDQQCGFMQVCHGKRAPLARVQPGDRVAYYAPAQTMGGKDRLQSFVSIGIVQPGAPYEFDMGTFLPWRRDVRYIQAQTAPIAPLIAQLEFIDDPRRWGYQFRFGLFKISEHDMRLIAQAMQADFASLSIK